MSGETGCIPVYGTQTEIAVNTFLDNFHTTEYSVKDNNQCEAACPFKSEDVMRSDYMNQARQGFYKHERAWRRDQKEELRILLKEYSDAISTGATNSCLEPGELTDNRGETRTCKSSVEFACNH